MNSPLIVTEAARLVCQKFLTRPIDLKLDIFELSNFKLKDVYVEKSWERLQLQTKLSTENFYCSFYYEYYSNFHIYSRSASLIAEKDEYQLWPSWGRSFWELLKL